MKYCDWKVFVIAAALGGCAGASGEGETVALQLALSSSASANAGGTSDAKPKLIGREADGGEFAIEEARAVVEKIELYLPTGKDKSDSAKEEEKGASEDSDNSDKLTIRGPFVVNLIDGTSTPSLDAVQIPAGTYRRIDVRFSDEANGHITDSDPLMGHTLVAGGQFTPSESDAMPFDMALDFHEDARFESETGIEIGADGANEILLKLDVASWFSGLPVSDCMAKGDLPAQDGTLVLDERAECSHVERDLRDAIRQSGRLEHH